MIRSRLQYQILMSVSAITLLGLFTLALYTNFVHQRNLTDQNSKALQGVLESTNFAIKTLMHSGYADIGTVLQESIFNMSEVTDIEVARLDGVRAFENNLTIQNVNKTLGYQRFELHSEEHFNQVINFTTDEMIKRLQQGVVFESIDRNAQGDRVQTLYYPIKNEESCGKCHSGSNRFRGWIKLKSSLKEMDAAIVQSRYISIGIVFVTLAIIIFIVQLYVRHVILPPVLKLSNVISNITGQNLTETVDLVSHVEFSRIADNFNLMVGKLSTAYHDLMTEKQKLSTLILDSNEGIVVTDQDKKVVLVNDAAIELLGKTKDQITENGIKGLFDEVSCPIDTIIEGDIGDVKARNIPYRQQILRAQVAKVLTLSGLEVGAAAIFKDVTEEVRLKEELNRLARTDGLTGLFNRRHFDETAKVEIARATRYGHPISLIIFDIDHFKRVNDTHGHDVGDVVIKAVADIGKKCIREFDLICRYGGEEYVILLPNTDLTSANDLAETIRKEVEVWSHGQIKVTISLGIAGSPPNPAIGSDELIKLADKQLYKAKNGGRNQVQCQWTIGDLA